jgi:rSAM/selenodomain-associated transferase 2/rSAM/selenodomain-associated transferase 1
VIVLTRSPEPGRVKTRLVPALGPEGAAAVHAALVEHTLDAVSEYCRASAADGVIRLVGGATEMPNASRNNALRIMPQHGDDLGERLDHAVREAFREGARQVIAIGTDCPDLDAPRLAEAMAALKRADVVVGPAVDGGYYLVGMRQHRPELFQNIAWGTDAVRRQTVAVSRRLGLRVRLLTVLSDIDEPEDLLVWRRLGGAMPGCSAPPRTGVISVVIPTVNEASRIAATLHPLMGRDDLEVIVVDGGSTDGTVAIARDSGARVIPTRPGRARQMNAGAAVASGERLLFLHADTRLPDGFVDAVHGTLDGGSVAGAFRLRIDSDRPGLRWIEWGANLRSRLFQLPYGDQGLFMNAATFYEAGGFRDMPLMEDFEICRRLRRTGPVTLAPLAVSTSAGRWLSLGVVRTTLVNQLCIAGFLVGVSPAILARLYKSHRGRE